MDLKALRKSRGLTQKDLADKLDVSISVISRYEAGNIVPSQERIKELADILGVMADEIDIPSNTRVSKTTNENPINRLISYTCLYRSNGCCELCGNKAPFVYRGHPYLKIHRLDDNKDLFNNIDNYAALCPNCYAKVSLLKNPEDIKTIKENIIKDMEDY